MQLRRIGSLLPLAQALLALVVGCSHQSADPDLSSAPGSTSLDSSNLSTSAATGTATCLERVDKVPHLQQAPLAQDCSGTCAEIVQTRYRPAAADVAEAHSANLPRPQEFSRAPDYTWLQGELLFSSVRGVWRLRYAAAEEEDPYGGSVTLVDVDASLGLQAGQHVRVRGKLINPRTSEPSPYYHVLEVERTR